MVVSENFLKAFKKLSIIEGGYSCNPNDRGGETYKGISRKWHPDWKGWGIIDWIKQEDPDSLFDERYMNKQTTLQKWVSDFYLKEYWLNIKLNSINNQELREELFEMSVNIGKPLTKFYLQQSVNFVNSYLGLPVIEVDKIIGSKTVAAVNHIVKVGEGELLIKVLNILQGCYYLDIVKNDNTQAKFLKGWLRRVK